MKTIRRLALLVGLALAMTGLAAASASADDPACVEDDSNNCYSGPVNLTGVTFDANDVDAFFADGTNAVALVKAPNNVNGLCTSGTATATLGSFATLPQPFSLDTLSVSGGGPTGKCKANIIGANQADVVATLPQTGTVWIDTSSPHVRGRDGALKFDGAVTVAFKLFNNNTPVMGAGGTQAQCVYQSNSAPEGDAYNPGGGTSPETGHSDVIVLNKIQATKTAASNYAACPGTGYVYLEGRPRTPSGGVLHIG